MRNKVFSSPAVVLVVLWLLCTLFIVLDPQGVKLDWMCGAIPIIWDSYRLRVGGRSPIHDKESGLLDHPRVILEFIGPKLWLLLGVGSLALLVGSVQDPVDTLVMPWLVGMFFSLPLFGWAWTSEKHAKIARVSMSISATILLLGSPGRPGTFWWMYHEMLELPSVSALMLVAVFMPWWYFGLRSISWKRIRAVSLSLPQGFEL